MIDEDALVKKMSPGVLSRHKDSGRHMRHSYGHKCYECGYAMEESQSTCEQCGAPSMYEKHHKHMHSEKSSCNEHGHMFKEGQCLECGIMEEQTLAEANCGCPPTCAGCDTCDDEYETGDYEVLDYDADNDFIPDHMHFEYNNDVLTPGEAFGVGVSVGHHDHDVKIGNHKHYKGSYMAKNHMYKTAKYAQKLYNMIPDGHNLEDWMRSKLAQIADDISEVYHALDHDIYEGDV